MKYVPSAVQDVDLAVAQGPFFGGEFAVYMTQQPAVLIGTVRLSGAGAGTWTANPGAAIRATGADLQVVPVTPINSSEAVVIKLAGMDDTGTPVAMDGTATFSPPARSGNQSYNFARGFAVELVPATQGKMFTEITGLAASNPITGGGRNQVFRVYQLPEQTDYELIVANTEINFNAKDRMPKGVDANMEADFWVKRGKGQPGELTISSKFRGFSEGMARYGGQKCTCMLVGVKDDQVTTDRLVFTGYVQSGKPTLPDGDGESIHEATGRYEDHLFFIAP